MNPQVALEQQALLRDRLGAPEYPGYMLGFLRDVKRKKAGAVIGDERGNPDGGAFCSREIERLNMAEAYYLSGEMLPLVTWAAAGLNQTDAFEHEVWPTDYGFVFFEEPLPSTEMYGRTVVTKAMTWGRATATESETLRSIPGTMVVLYTDFSDARDEVNTEIKAEAEFHNDWVKYERMGRLHVHHIMWVPDGLRVGPEKLIPPERYADYAVGDQQLAKDAPNDGRFLLAFLMMLNQTVTSVEEHTLDRKGSRRFKRMGLPDRVTVVRLRRHKNIDRLEGETLVEWAHRWVVRGHWRNQPYKDDDGTTIYKRIWIAPHVKGPEGAPLKQSQKIYALVR